MTLLRQGNFSEDEPIDLTAYGGMDLWLEINLKPTWEGLFRETLYKPRNVYLVVWGQSHHRQEFRAPASMLAAGFLASPLVLNDQDTLNLYTSKTIIRPAAYAVQLPPGTSGMWRSPNPIPSLPHRSQTRPQLILQWRHLKYSHSWMFPFLARPPN